VATGDGKPRLPEWAPHFVLLGGRLRQHRLEHGLTLRAAALRAGINPSTLSRIERGEQRELTAVSLFTICYAIELDPNVAWYGSKGKRDLREDPTCYKPLPEVIPEAPVLNSSAPPPESTRRASKRPPKG
jgi:transcriptional regulator with XRE-family HTH domain